VRNPTKMLHCHAERPNQVTIACRSSNQGLRGYSQNGSKSLLGKHQENYCVNRSLTLVLDRGWSRFSVVGDLSLSYISRDRRVADCICAKGAFNIIMDVNCAHALLVEMEAD
jgi:hypothetical protein